jgi:thiol-disulfide isomerase/thioredoxin
MRLTAFVLLMLMSLTGCQEARNDTKSTATTDTAAATADGESSSAAADEVQPAEPDDRSSGILAPGSPAAAIDLTAVVHGAPFESLQNDKVYVVEFWATWCGPCLASMPHISDLQKEYGEAVQFVGVSDEDAGTVTEFLAKDHSEGETWADVLRYTIAVDEDGTTQRDYLGAAQQNGIPCAFIVNKDGIIAWIGHPIEIDGPLQAVVEGKWNIEKARSDFLATVTPAEPPQEPVVDVDPLEPGLDAPAVQVASVVQGAAVEPFHDGKVYVVEFWATWCGPCLASMPHISDLQKEYGEAVQFVGVTREDEGTVDDFMEQESPAGGIWSEALSYSIALDDDSTTWQNYMTAAGQGGIPCAFIVDKAGKVAWIGHPMEIDEPLASVVDGSFDTAAAAKQFQVEKQLQPALQQGDFAKALEVLDLLLEIAPASLQYGMMKMQILGIVGQTDDMLSFTAVLLETHKENAKVLNAVAMILMDQADLPDESLDLALKAAVTANEVTEGTNGSILDTRAKVHPTKGELTQAVEWQKKAVDASPTMEELQETLKEYEANLAAQENSADQPEPKENVSSQEKADTDESASGDSEADVDPEPEQ